MKVCAKCGTKIGRKDRFCSKCGGTTFNETSAKVKFCLYCGAVIDSKAKFCAKCGKSCEGDISLSFLDEKKDAPETVELDFLKKQEEPAAELDFLKKQEEPAAELDFLKKQEEPAAELDFLKKQEEPAAELDFLKKQEEPAAELDFLKKQEEPELDFLKNLEEEKKKAEEEARKAEEEMRKAEEKMRKAEEEMRKAEEEARKAEEERKKAEEEEARKAEEERKKAEEEAARKAEEERKKAEEEARKAEEERKKAEEEAARKAEEERKKAEEEAARKAEEERKKAEEEAARKAEEERKKAEEEAARKAEEERKKAEEERKRKELEALRVEAVYTGKRALDKSKTSEDSARIELENVLDKFNQYFQQVDKETDDKEDKEAKELAASIKEVLGVIYYREKSYKLAVPLLKDAGDQNKNRAKIYLTDWYLRNRKEISGKPEDLKKDLEDALADEKLMKEYPEDRIKANMALARIFADGIGVKKNPAEAFAYYLKCAELGDVEAMALVGNGYLYGEGVKKDTKAAFLWNEKAAKAGNERAIRNLAVSYDFGTGVKKDAKQAVEWYKKLLENIGNDRFAKFRIAMCLSDPDRDYGNKPTPEMYQEAISYAKQAVEEGEKNANYVLGYCYTYGKGVKADHGQAYTYYSKAASNGHQKAKNQLNSFVKTGMGNYVYKGI